MRRANVLFLDVCISSPGIANEVGGITLTPVSMNLGQPCKMEAQAPCHPQVNQAQEVHLSSASKPKKTGSLALFYRKVGVFIRKSCFTSVRGHAETCLLVQFSLPFSLHVRFLWHERFLYTWEEKGNSVAENPIFPFPLPMKCFMVFFL